MKILILGLNYAPEKVGIAVYTSGMAEALVQMGHHVTLVAGQPYYPEWKTHPGYPALRYTKTIEQGVNVMRVPHYVPARPNGSRRLLHHFSFAAAALAPTLWLGITWRPDIVLTVAPSLIAAPVARLAAALSGARSWLHVQDFEVEAAIATGLLPKASKTARIASWFERLVLQSFDTVSTISPQMAARLLHKGLPVQRIVELRNWSDIDAITPRTLPSPFRAEWSITTPHVALYSGNIANKQGIEIVMDVARTLQRRHDLTFVICGEGPNRSRLEAAAAGLENIQFRDLQPKERLNDLLGLATIHLLPQLSGAADLVLPSKLANMLASGRPVVATASPGTGLAQEVQSCGIATEPGNAGAFATAIEHLMDDETEYALLAKAARERAELRWHSKTILAGLDHHLAKLVTSSRDAATDTARPISS